MFELTAPWALLFLGLPLLIRYACPAKAVELSQSLKVPFYDSLLNAMGKQSLQKSASAHNILFSLIWICMIIAVSGPRWVGEPIMQNQEGRNIMMVLDISGSMGVQDMEMNDRLISRLAVVKRAAKQFIASRVGDRIGLILFGSKAYLQTPLTFDKANVLLRIEDATPGLAGQTTSIGDALGLSIKKLQSVPEKSRVVILLTDGVNNSGVLTPIKAAQLAHEEKINVYTIGLARENANTPDLLNFSMQAELDEDSLKEIAQLTGGRYFRATDPQSLQIIYDNINKLEPIVHTQKQYRPQKEYYFWPLSLAFLLILYFFIASQGWSIWRKYG